MDPETPIADYAERPRVDGWTLRSALVRYAQPEPARASAVLELLRRVDGALRPHLRLLEQTPELNAIARTSYELGNGQPGSLDADTIVRALTRDERTSVELLVAALGLDALGDLLAAWATRVDGPRPDAELDALARQVFAVLSDLDVPRETRPPRT